jgi:DNA-binding NarL/FixJ family response regulator
MRVLIVVDNALTAEAIRREMRHAPTCRVIGYVNGRRPCALAVADAAPDLVLIDDAGEQDSTLQRIREVRSTVPAAKVVLLTARMDDGRLEDALDAGIDSAISKAAPPASVGLLIREVAAGNVFHAFARRTVSNPVSSFQPNLTAREHEILRWVAAGASNSAIARELFVTEQTVKFHLSNVYRKLGVANRTEASHYAHVHGLIDATQAQPMRTPLRSVPAAA